MTNANFHEVKIGKQLGKGNYGVVNLGEWGTTKVAVKKVSLSVLCLAWLGLTCLVRTE